MCVSYLNTANYDNNSLKGLKEVNYMNNIKISNTKIGNIKINNNNKTNDNGCSKLMTASVQPRIRSMNYLNDCKDVSVRTIERLFFEQVKSQSLFAVKRWLSTAGAR